MKALITAMNRVPSRGHLAIWLVSVAALLVSNPTAANASCFCDTGKQEFILPDDLTCLTIVPSEGCVRARIGNNCGKAVTLVDWPGNSGDQTIADGAVGEVQIYGYNSAVPTSTALSARVESTTYTITHETPKTCADGTCTSAPSSNAPGPAGPAAVTLGLIVLLLVRRRVHGRH